MADEKDSKWQCYIIPDLATWTGAAASDHTPIEFYDTYEQAAARFQELRSEPYNSGDLPAARLTFGVQRENPPSAADLLQVRQGKNYLVDDYTRMDALNQSPEVMDILKQMRKDLGFDRVRVYERDAYGGFTGPKDMAFSRWKHPLKPSLRKSVLKELKETDSQSTPAPKVHRKKEWGRE